MNNKLKPGYYWIKPHMQIWQIGWWDGGGWHVMGVVGGLLPTKVPGVGDFLGETLEEFETMQDTSLGGSFLEEIKDRPDPVSSRLFITVMVIIAMILMRPEILKLIRLIF